jgi:uncharacterized protein (TIRG00374 family)
MPRRGRGWWLRLLFNLAVLGFLVWAAFTFPWRETLAALRNTRPWLLVIAGAIHLVAFIAKGWAWQLLLKPVAPCRWWVCQEANMVGTAINNVSIMLVGEGTRAKIVRDRDGIPLGLGISSILWARILEGVSYAFFLGIAPFFLKLPDYYRPAQIVALASLGALTVINLARHWVPRRFPRVSEWWEGARGRIARWGWVTWLSRRTPESVKRALHALIDIPLVTPALPWILLLSMLNWALEWVDIDITFRAIGAPISIGASFAVMTFTNAAWLVRITPGNIGIVQGASVLALLPFGVPPNIAIVGGLVLQAIQGFPPLILAGILALTARIQGRWGGKRKEGGRGRGRQQADHKDHDRPGSGAGGRPGEP